MTETEVTIHDVAFGGSGVGRLPDGKVVFIPYTLPKETVRIHLEKSKKKFTEGELTEIITPSPSRVSPPCVYYGECGGCQYQHVAYPEQLDIKKKQLQDILQRIGKFQNLPEIHVEPSPQEYGYRNKISVHSGSKGELGFFARDQRTVVDIERCLIADDIVNEQLATLRKRSSKPRHVSLTNDSQRSDSFEGGFHQVNTPMAEKILKQLADHLGEKKDFQLLDLYCGSGFFSLGLAPHFSTVRGVDWDPRAIHAATVRTQILKIPQAQFFAANVEDRINWLLDETIPAKTVLLLDPPREGLPPKVSEAIANKLPAHLIYISCNPSTLARDLKKIMEINPGKYGFQKIALFDMFPQTAHIETFVSLKRSD